MLKTHERRCEKIQQDIATPYKANGHIIYDDNNKGKILGIG